jgi:DHA2 family multidrug resistance protein
MPLVGYLLGKGWDGRKMVMFGFVVTGMAFFGYSHMNLQSGTLDILLSQINQGAGMAFVFVPLTTLTMDPIPKAETGYATSLYSVMRNVGSSMGVSFVTTFVARRSQFHQSVLGAHLTPYSRQVQPFLSRAGEMFFRAGSDRAAAASQSLAVLYRTMQQQASLLSFVEAFRVMAILFLAIVPLVLAMRRSRETRRAHTAPAE